MSNINKLYLIFPDTHKELCNIISQGLMELLKVTCKQTIYNLLELKLEDIYYISKALDDTSILIIAYWDVIPPESFYKLGIAFEKKSSIILLHIQSNTQSIQEIPSYVKNDFPLTFVEAKDTDLIKNLRNLLVDLKKIIETIESNDLIFSLYHKSLIYCQNLEKKTCRTIDTVDFNLFKERFIFLQEEIGNEDLHQKISRIKKDELFDILFKCIAADKYQIYEILTIARNLRLGKQEDINTKKIIQNITYNQYRQDDNFLIDRKDMNNPPPKPKKNNPWKSGSFYLLAFVVVSFTFTFISKYAPWYVIIPIFIAVIISVGVIGAFQLMNDDEITETNFLKLMLETYKRLPLLIQDKSNKNKSS